MHIKKAYCLVGLIIVGCASRRATTAWEPHSYKIVNAVVTKEKPGVIKPGLLAIDSVTVIYNKGKKQSLEVTLGEPIIVTKSTEPQEWGNYQFPTISPGTNGGLVVKTHMSPDAVASYGKTRYIYSYSDNPVEKWKSEISAETVTENNVADGVLLPNGDRLKIVTPPSINESQLDLPKPVAVKGNFKFYRLTDLPASRKGVFMARMKKGTTVWVNEQNELIDPAALRYSLKNEMPVVWWGDIKVAADGSLITGVYPGYYINEKGEPDTNSGIFFYRSANNGKSWKIQGRIPFRHDSASNLVHENKNYTEPAFEILKDGTYLCVMRTTDDFDGPMYQSKSTDGGKIWTEPKAFTAAGVLPRLLQLDNGIVVLSSGRPGVQIRFSDDGNNWTTPFEMLHYTPVDRVDWFTSCGYTGLLAAGPNSFFIVYSDFFTMNERGQMRKSIKLRKVTVKNRYK